MAAPMPVRSTGGDEAAETHAPGHVDLALRRCTVEFGGDPVVCNGVPV